MKKRGSIVLGWAIGLLGLGLSVGMLKPWLAKPEIGQVTGLADTHVAEKFQLEVNNRVSTMVSDVAPAMQKTYKLSDANLVAPVPNPDGFGEITDAEALNALLARAEKLLDGQQTLLTAQTVLKPDSTIGYYLDDTILAMTWKQAVEGGIYTFAEVKIADASQFRRFLADGKYGGGVLYTTTEMSAAVNAVVASSGDYYGYRSFGIVVNDGHTYRAKGELLDTCYIDPQGDMHFTYAREMTGEDAVQSYVDENKIRFTLSFGPVMIRDGEYCVPEVYNSGEINSPYPRAALCQLGKLHYLLVAANTEDGYYHLPTVGEFGKQLQQMGVPTAYALDGGQTAAIAMNHQLVNTVSYGAQREISDIIYFATAIPNSEKGGDGK